jgi:hypothetical protein
MAARAVRRRVGTISSEPPRSSPACVRTRRPNVVKTLSFAGEPNRRKRIASSSGHGDNAEREPIAARDGTLSYDEFGNMDVQIRVEPATADTLERAGITSDQGVISTKGRTAVDMQARTPTYVLTGQPSSVARLDRWR